MEGRDVRFHHLVLSPTRRSKRGLLAGELERTALEVKNARLAIAGETHKLILRLQIISVWGRGGQLSIRCRLRSTSPTFPHNHTSPRTDPIMQSRVCRSGRVQIVRGLPRGAARCRRCVVVLCCKDRSGGIFYRAIINLGLAEGWSLERAVFFSTLMC